MKREEKYLFMHVKYTSATVKKIVDNLLHQEELEEYVGVKLYYFGKKYDSLVKRGL